MNNRECRLRGGGCTGKLRHEEGKKEAVVMPPVVDQREYKTDKRVSFKVYSV